MKKTLLLFIILITIPAIYSECQHDKYQAQMPFIYEPQNSDPEGRTLQISSRQNIRMAAYYEMSQVRAASQTTIKEQLLPAALSFYQAALKVNRLDQLQISGSKLQNCGVKSLPSELINGIPADFVVFSQDLVTSADFLAVASACVLDTNSRPLLGIISWKTDMDWNTTNEIAYEQRLYVTIHELGHSLGFSKSLFSKYINPITGSLLSNPTTTKVVNGETITILQAEPLRTKVRDHFGCTTLEGAYIEQEGSEGSAGSHLERRVFFNDVITASLMNDGRISEIFLAALESSGWYSVDYGMAEPFLWGKGEGCSFLEQTCLLEDGTSRFQDNFCSNSSINTTQGCIFGGTGTGVCSNVDTFADSCPYTIQYSNRGCKDSNNGAIYSGEVFGSQSMCFSGTIKSGSSPASQTQFYCFNQTCQKVGSSYQIIISLKDESITCTSAGPKSASNYAGVINCPDPNTYCTTDAIQYCPRGCMGRGACKNDGICECYEGYSGIGCSTRTTTVTAEGTLYYLTRGRYGNDKDDNSFHFIAIPIGIAIIGGTLFFGLIINKIRSIKLQRSQNYTENAKVNIEISSREHKPNIQTNVYRANIYQSVSVNGDMTNAEPIYAPSGMMDLSQAQPILNSTEVLRQEALRSNFKKDGNKNGGADALSVLRGQRS